MSKFKLNKILVTRKEEGVASSCGTHPFTQNVYFSGEVKVSPPRQCHAPVLQAGISNILGLSNELLIFFSNTTRSEVIQVKVEKVRNFIN